MDLRTYRASSMAGALAAVKKDLGPDAVIVRTRSSRAGGLLGIGSKPAVEITATLTPPNLVPRSTDRVRASRPADAGSGSRGSALATDRSRDRSRDQSQTQPRPRASARTAARGADSAPLGPKPSPIAPAAELAEDIARSLAPAEAADLDSATDHVPSRPRTSDLATNVKLSPQNEGVARDLDAELAAIRRMMGQVLRTTRRTASHLGDAAPTLVSGADALFDAYSALVERGVPEEAADELTDALRAELSADELADEDIVRQCLLRQIERMLPCVPKHHDRGRPADGRPRTLVLVGPTGVGKTTTIAKLAASIRLKEGRRVGLVTWDTYRIAAVEQLRTYADIIGIPVRVAMTAPEAAIACQRMADMDVLLIDSAGRSQHDAARLEEIAGFVRTIVPHETHLVLPATASAAVMRAAAQRFGSASPDRLILTKLDEAAGPGAMIEATRATGLRLSYLTVGQEVPDDIERARSERLARRVLANAGDRSFSPGPDDTTPEIFVPGFRTREHAARAEDRDRPVGPTPQGIAEMKPASPPAFGRVPAASASTGPHSDEHLPEEPKLEDALERALAGETGGAR